MTARGDEPQAAQTVVIRAALAPSFDPGPFNPFYRYNENAAPLPIAPDATFSDADSPTLPGGSLLVSLAGGAATEQLGIQNQGSGAGQIGLSGANVTYGGLAIGTVSGGAPGGSTITIAFNGSATPAAVQALARSVTYWSSSENPASGTRTFTLTADDGTGGQAQITRMIGVMPLDDAPTIANLDGDVVQFSGGSPPVRMDQPTAAQVADVDNSNFANGSLDIVMIENRVVTEDLFGIASGAGITLAGNNVSVNGTLIGTVDGLGTAGANLHFQFNSAATPGLVSQLIGALTYQNTNGVNPSLLTRAVTFTLSDGGFIGFGGTNTVTATTHINVTGGTPVPPPPPSPPPPIVFAMGDISDTVLRADGLRMYSVSAHDGLVRVYRAETGAFITSWNVGQLLSSVDLSLDGRSLIATGYQVLASSPQGTPEDLVRSTVACYRIDLETGAITQFLYEAHGTDRTFGDAAFLDNGLVLLAQGSSVSPGNALMKLLNIDTGQYVEVNTVSGGLFESLDGNRVFVSRSSIPGGIYDADTGFTPNPSSMAVGAALAHSAEAGLIVTAEQSAGLKVYDGNGQYQMQLLQYLSIWNTGVEGLAFDETGSFLFVLDSGDDAIYQLRTSDWAIVNTIPLGTAINGGGDLQVGPDMRYFTFFTGTGLLRIDNPHVADAIVGTLGNDSLNGTAGNDTLIGDSGVDVMTGGAGNDIYYVDNPGDILVEAAGGGSDSARAGVSYALAAGLEVERLETTTRYGTQALDLFGNEFANDIRGNNGPNLLGGGGGNDTMTGFGGNDIYVVGEAGDLVVEGAGAGTDEIQTTLTSFSLGSAANVENLTGLSSLNSTLTGTGGANVIRSGPGFDSLVGGAGDDIYYVNDAQDSVTEGAGQGHDVVYARTSWTMTAGQFIELLTGAPDMATADFELRGNELGNVILGNAGSNSLYGYAGDDRISGGGGNDRLVGGSGSDRLEGGAGSDVFVYEGIGDSSLVMRSDGAKFMPDVIMDFTPGQDRIDLSAMDANLATPGNDSFAFIGTNAFTGVAGQLRYESHGDFLILLGDCDGNGGADFRVVVQGAATLQWSDFTL